MEAGIVTLNNGAVKKRKMPLNFTQSVFMAAANFVSIKKNKDNNFKIPRLSTT